jgi:Ca-activated chloride channel family protein
MPRIAETSTTHLISPGAACCLRHSLPSFILCICLVLSAVPVKAQTPTSEDDVVRVSTDLLLFPIRIRNKQKQAVLGLVRQDLLLKDEDHAISNLLFQAGAERVSLVFALDQSGSLRETIEQQRDAALALFGRFSSRSKVAVVRFAETASLVSPFDRDAAAARAAFTFPARTNQHTAIFDGAAAALKAFDALAPDRSERRIVILISDGLDNASKTKANRVIEMALDKHVSFYVVHLPLFEPREGHLAVRQPAKGFRDLAEKTGGAYFLVGDAKAALAPARTNDLTPIFQAIEEDLKSQYLLGFYIAESARDGRRHRFSVSLAPAGLEYSLGKLEYSRSHDFFVNMQPGDSKSPRQE